MTIDPGFVATALAAIVTALASSFVTYYAIRRAKSGQIRTTEADVLWTEAGAIRRELREQVQQLELHISANEAEIARLRAENAELKHEVLTLRAENASLNGQIVELRAENVTLRDELKKQAPKAQGGTSL